MDFQDFGHAFLGQATYFVVGRPEIEIRFQSVPEVRFFGPCSTTKKGRKDEKFFRSVQHNKKATQTWKKFSGVSNSEKFFILGQPSMDLVFSPPSRRLLERFVLLTLYTSTPTNEFFNRAQPNQKGGHLLETSIVDSPYRPSLVVRFSRSRATSLKLKISMEPPWNSHMESL